jgi:hypothetical protein
MFSWPTNTLKRALQGETNKNYIAIAEDWKNWIREKQEGIRQAEWTSSENLMITVKPRILRKITAHRHSREETKL